MTLWNPVENKNLNKQKKINNLNLIQLKLYFLTFNNFNNTVNKNYLPVIHVTKKFEFMVYKFWEIVLLTLVDW